MRGKQREEMFSMGGIFVARPRLAAYEQAIGAAIQVVKRESQKLREVADMLVELRELLSAAAKRFDSEGQGSEK